MTKTVLIPLPSRDFDPTEAAVPCKILKAGGCQVFFATPGGNGSRADSRMLTGEGLGILAPFLRADQNGKEAYHEMESSKEFRNPLKWSDVSAGNFDAILLPGGHAPGMKEYLESEVLQALVRDFYDRKKIVGAICHGVVLAARSRILSEKKTTALLKSQELLAWALTCAWLGNYYRTYPVTVEEEVRSLANEFISGPMPVLRDSPGQLERGFCVRDGNYVSARWPGDAHVFAHTFLEML